MKKKKGRKESFYRYSGLQTRSAVDNENSQLHSRTMANSIRFIDNLVVADRLRRSGLLLVGRTKQGWITGLNNACRPQLYLISILSDQLTFENNVSANNGSTRWAEEQCFRLKLGLHEIYQDNFKSITPVDH
jgi:hypothetical protein